MYSFTSVRMFVAGLVLVFLNSTLLAQQAAPGVERFHKDVEPILVKYCYQCHGDGGNKGKVSFDALTTDAQILDHDLWLRALKNLRAGLMPPKGQDRPSADEMKVLVNWIKRDGFGIDMDNPDPGRVTLRRLNRAEYHNTIRDLMGYDFKVEEEFPPDDTGYGFDTIGDVLSVSPMLLEKYMQAAEVIVPASVGIVPKIVRETTITGNKFIGGFGPNADRISFAKGGTFSQKANVELAGDYKILVQTSVKGSFDFDPGRVKLSFKVDGAEKATDEYGWQDGKKYNYEIAAHFEPGDHDLTFEVTKIEAPPATAPAEQVAQDPPDAQALAAAQQDQQQQQAQAAVGLPAGPPRKTNIDLQIVSVRVQGPLDPSQWVTPENYSRYFTLPEPPKTEPQRTDYARQTLERFATLAFRRPVDSRTLDKLVAIAKATYTQPDKQFEQGIQQAMIALLSSPRFIFRIEDSIPAGSQPYSLIDEYALASRLSYFLWSTMPDDQLFTLAQQGQLRAHLDEQVKRMLADPRSEAFVQNFAGQWLQTRDIETVPINAKVVLARDAGTEAQLKAEEEAARAGRGNRGQFGARGNRGQGFRGQQQQPAPAQQQQQQDPNAQPQTPAAPQQQQPIATADVAAPAADANAKAADPANPQVAVAQPDNPQAAQAAPAAGARGAFGARGNRGNRGAGARGNRGAAAAPIDLDAATRRAMRQETEMYFSHVVHEDRSVLELIDSNYTYLNAALAKWYNIPNVTGNQLQLVTLPDGSPRGGILTQGTILAVTSNPTRTSPVKRGLFILDNILGTPPPPPPNDIPPLEDAEKKIEGHEPTVRESLELHRNTPMCQACHSRMDPLGLALENFNAMGMWREKERNQPVEVSGQLVTGEELKSAADLKHVIVNEHRLDYYRTLTEKLMTYALGRGMEYYDTQTIDQIVDKLEKDNGRFTTLLNGIIDSPAFQKRRNGPMPVASAQAAAQPPLTDSVPMRTPQP